MNNMRNKVQLIGNLGANPEIKTLESGRKMARMSIATHEMYTNQKGERITETEWHNIVAWGKTAELVERLLQKGSEILVDGKLTHREFTGPDEVKRYFTEIVVNDFLLLDKRQATAQ